MKITSVKIKLFDNEKFKAEIAITINDLLFIDNIKIICDKQKSKYFLSMPSIKNSFGQRHDVFHPTNEKARQYLEALLIEFYYKCIKDKNQKQIYYKDISNKSNLYQQSIEDFKECDNKTESCECKDTFSITSFKIKKANTAGNIKAFASFVIDDDFVVKDLKIILNSTTNEYMLCMPQSQTKSNTKKDLLHPINNISREKLEGILLNGYKLLLKSSNQHLFANANCNNPIEIQKISDFNYEYTEIITPKEKHISAPKSTEIVAISESFEEKVYKTPYSIVEKLKMYNNENCIKGRIVGNFCKDFYKVVLSNGKIGVIKCELLDSYFKVIDYENKTFCNCDFSNEGNKNEDSITKHINKEYYFEIVDERTDGIFVLSIENIKIDFLDYVISNKIILCGMIVQIDNYYTGIEIPYGFVFFTKTEHVFGCKFDPMFDYMNYVGAEISVLISYNTGTNKIYPIVANKLFPMLDNRLSYIFPALTVWNMSYFSKLWLEKNVQFDDKNKKIPLKHINQLLIVDRLREKGELKKLYKCNVKGIVPENNAIKFRKSLLTIGWIINLRGHDLNTAIKYLQDKGFPYVIRYSYNYNTEMGKILSMKPDIKEKAIIPKNVVIELNVSQGKRKEFIMPDFIGMPIKEVYHILNNNKLSLKYKVTNEITDGIEDNCVVQTWPSAGNVLLSGKTVNAIIYKKNNYESPFALRENEHVRINHNAKIIGTMGSLHQYIKTPWQKTMLEFILKHKIANSVHIKSWIKIVNDTEISTNEINKSLKYLQSLSMVGSIDVCNDISSKANIRFLFPLKSLYQHYKEYCDYNGFFSLYDKDTAYYKTRAAENQTFIKLYNIFKNQSTIKYEVDCIQNFSVNDLQKYLKIHFAVKTINIKNNSVNVYFIEAIRFLNEEQLLEKWDKLIRYNLYFDGKYTITPKLLLIFEDKKHYEVFISRKPIDFKLQRIDLFYTWDKLTNSESDKFEDIFIKENTL